MSFPRSPRACTATPQRTRRLILESLEDRTLLASPLSLSDPTTWGTAGVKASATPSISSDGQLIAFTSDADNLVPNDANNLTDTFVYNRATGTVSLVSVGVSGMAAGTGTSAAISPDGRYVLFDNGGYYLHQPVVAGIGGPQFYLRDLQTGTTKLLTYNATGTGGATGTPSAPVWSADSRHVAFLSNANDLVAGVTYSDYYGSDLFVRDLTTNTTQLVSVSLDGTHNGNADTGNFGRNFGISADGRYVAFRSSASNLVAITNSGIEQVYRRDLLLGVTTMVSVESSGLAGAGGHNNVTTGGQVISADGRYVVFHTNASDVLPGVGGGNAYLRDLEAETTVLLSASATGAGVGSTSEILSPDGRWAAWATSTNGVTALPTNGKTNVYVRNTATGAVTLASVNRAGTAGGNDGSGIGTFFDFPGNLSFSPDGRYLAFRSLATDLTTGVTTRHRNLYARDLVTNTTVLLTPNAAGGDGGDADSDTAVFSTDGRFVAFQSTSNNLVAGDNRRVGSGGADQDVFVRDLTAAHPVLVSARTPLLPAAFTSLGGGALHAASADGRIVAFTSNVFYGQTYSDLVPGVTFNSVGQGQEHVFVRNRDTGAVRVLDIDKNGVAIGGGGKLAVSPNGRYVAFFSTATTFVDNVTYSGNNIFLRDLQTNTIRLVTVNGTTAVPVSGIAEIAISDDGRWVAFNNDAAAPYPGISNPSRYRAVYLRDMQSNTTTLVSHDVANDGQVRGHSQGFSMSADGRYIAFVSGDANLTASDTNNGMDVFRWDRTTNLVSLVSVSTTGNTPGNGGAWEGVYALARMSADGRHVVFTSSASNLTTNDTNGTAGDVFVRDMTAGVTTLVSVNAAGTASGNANSFWPSISADGGAVAFVSSASNLVLGDGNNTSDTFVRFLTGPRAGTTVVVSANAAGTGTGNANSGTGDVTQSPRISPDGRYVAFLSHATDLVADFIDGNGNGYLRVDLFVRDLVLGKTKLTGTSMAGTASGNAGVHYANYFFGGGSLVFESQASDLFGNDRNTVPDVFAVPTAGYSTIRGQVYHDVNGNAAKDAGEVGARYWTVFLDADNDGVLDANEASLITDAAGGYAFTGLSVGTYKVAIVQQAEWSRTTAAPHTVTIATDGSIVRDKDFGETQPLPDLQTSGATFTPAGGAPGQLVTVSWTVTNRGMAAAGGAWQDAVYLSPTTSLGADAELLATVPRTGGLPVGGSYAGTTALPLPAREGTWYVVVRADRRSQVNEGDNGANKANNVAASAATLAVAVPTLSLGTPVSEQLSAASSDRYYRLSVPTGQSLVLTLSSAATSGQLELYVKRGELPKPYAYDLAARVAGQPRQTLTIPTVQAGTYYVLVRGAAGAARAAQFTLTATVPGVTLQSLGLTTGGNGGRVTIPVRGTNFTPTTAVTLRSGGDTLTPVAVEFRDPSLLFATFDLSGRPAGDGTVQVAGGTGSAAFTVAPARGPDLKVHLGTPTAIRANALARGAALEIEFENAGDVDMLAPVFQLSTDVGTLRLGQGGPAGDTLLLTGAGLDSPGGVLRAGDKGRMKVHLQLPQVIGIGTNSGGGGPSGATITLRTVATDAAPVDWAAYKTQLRPPSFPTDGWDAVWANFTANLGSTYGELQASLSAATAYLRQVGVENPTLPQLLAFELLRADAALPVATLGDATDASVPTPGVSLSFGRTFYQTISGRHHLGPLGRGWVSTWDITATTRPNGDVLTEVGGLPRLFTRQADGSYLGAPGQRAVLTADGEAYRLREADGTVLRFRPDGRLDAVVDANGTRVTAEYNAVGQLTKLTHSNGQALTLTYTAAGRVATVADPTGRLTTYTYDLSGEHLIRVTTPRGTTEYGYVTGQGAAREHALASVTEADGTGHQFTYDSQGRLTSTRQSGTTAVTLSYPSRGGVAFTDGANATATVLFNHLGQAAVTVDALGRATRLAYDAVGRVVERTQADGSTVGYGYDAVGNLARITDPLGRVTAFAYDRRFVTPTEFTDPRGVTTRFRYDAAGNLLAITGPDGGTERFAYDPVGNVTETTNRRGAAVGYAYNSAGQVTRVTFADGSHVDYTYDARGNLATATDATGATALEYDTADRLTKVTYPGGRFLQYTYTTGGQRSGTVDHTGYRVTYAYDAGGRLTRVSADGSPLVVYTYDLTGRLTRKDNGNGTRTTYEYDAAGQLRHLVNLAPDHVTVNSRFDYTYDALGRVATQDNSDGGWVYTYDAASQLTHAVFTSNDPGRLPGQDLRYFYDAAGNRTRVVENGVTTAYTVNARNEYVQVGSTAYTYDADGNLATRVAGGVTTTYTFDALSRLTGVAGPGEAVAYRYDALGNLAATTRNGQTVQSLIDPLGFGGLVGGATVVADFDGLGGLTAHYTHGLGLVSRADAGGTAYYDFDAVGSTVGLTAAGGGYVNRYSYQPFGGTVTLTAAVANRFTYVGQLGVAAAAGGLLRMGYRHYDAGVGQFVSNDALRLGGGDANFRRYAGNDPVNRADPLGLNPYDLLGPNDLLAEIQKLEQAIETAVRQNQVDPGGKFFRDPLVKNMEGALARAKDAKAARDAAAAAASAAKLTLGLEALLLWLLQPLAGMWGEDCGSLFVQWFPEAGEAFVHQVKTNAWQRNIIIFLGSADPNEVVGPGGFGTQNWVTPADPLPYTVKFENDPKKANAAAQDVFVTTTLDADLDWSTFQLGTIQFGSTTVTVPAGLRAYATTVLTTNVDGTPLRVDVAASLNLDTGVVDWVFRSLDPVTGEVPENPYAGFLPVNDATRRGEGQVTYTVRVKGSVPTETQVTAQASIVFDTNAAILTNVVTNPVYNGPRLLVADDYNRADSTSLGSPWVERAGNLAIAGDRLKVLSTIGLATAGALADAYVEADVTATSTKSAGLVARHSGTGDGSLYWGTLAGLNGRFIAEIWRRTGGVWKLLSRRAVTAGAGTLGFQVVGPSLKLFLNGGLVGFAFDSTLKTGAVGVRGGVGVTFDNFRASKLYAIAQVAPVSDGYQQPDGGQLDPVYWAGRVGNFSTTGNRLRGEAAVNLTTINGLSMADSDQRLRVAMPASGSQSVGLVARYAGNGADRNMYWASVAAVNGVYTARISRNVNGVWTQLTSRPLATGAGTLRLVAFGTSLRLYFDDALLARVTDAALTAGGVGVRASAGGVLDDYQLTPFVPAVTLPYADGFTAATGTPLTDAWRPVLGGFTVSNNKAVGTAAVNLATLTGVSATDVSLQLAVSLPSSGARVAGLVARYAGVGDRNMYWAGVTVANGVYTAVIRKNVTGTWTTLASRRLTKGTGTLRFDVVGSSLRLSFDGVQVAAATDAVLKAGGVGVRASKEALDDFTTR